MSTAAPLVAKREARVQDKLEAKRLALPLLKTSELRSSHEIVRGDARSLLDIVGKRQIHLVVTSPPYWNLKKYASNQNGAQLGHIADRENFLRQLDEVWRQCHQLLVPGGRMCVVVGDVCRSRKSFGRHVVEPLHAYIQTHCQEIGFDPLAPIIWYKITNMATEVAGNGNGFLGKPYEPNSIVKNDVEFILQFRKPGAYRHPTQQQRNLSMIEKQDYREWFKQIWTDVRGEAKNKHPAPFPREISSRLISMFSFVGDTVLDPFLGTGTTTQSAVQLHRSSIGVEIEPTYVALARRRVKALNPAFYNAELTIRKSKEDPSHESEP